MNPAAPIFLIGYMATGKTTLGRALEAAAGVEFVDLDDAIEQSQGMTVREIFGLRGEAEFRRLESEALAELLSRREGRRLVVACGGGTPCHGDNMDRMLERGTVVWLKARRDIVVRRLLDAPGQRPLVAGMNREELERFLAESLAGRTPSYSRAHCEFDSSELDTPDEVARTVGKFINQFLS